MKAEVIELHRSSAAADTAKKLSRLMEEKHLGTDQKNWQMCYEYNKSFERIAAEMIEDGLLEKMPSRHDRKAVLKINNEIRRQPGYRGPGITWLSHSKHVYETWPDTVEFVVNNKLQTHKESLVNTYEAYRLISNSNLKPEQKDELREWIETNKVTSRELRESIQKHKGNFAPDFGLKVGNNWRFSNQTIPDHFDGGIHPELVANLLHYFTNPGDTVIDPMAGGDTTYKVVNTFTYFQEENPNIPYSGPRTVHRSDINPIHAEIRQADILKGLPWADDFADFCLFDPPYWKVAEGKYGIFGTSIEEWRGNLRAALLEIKRTLKAGGIVAVIVDDYLRAREFQPLSAFAFEAASQVGMKPIATIYNSYPNFITTMSPAEMWRAKKSRLMVNQTKIVHVFETAMGRE